MVYRRITSINWREEANKVTLTYEEMLSLLEKVMAERKPAKTKTSRKEFDELHYGLDSHGDWYELYMYDKGEYWVFSNNAMDSKKNERSSVGRADRLFDETFKELNGESLRVAYGFVDASLKRCIPKQFYYVNPNYLNKRIVASSIDASSQYPSGCLGRLPDMHNAIRVSGRIRPTEEWPFAFYASGHCAEYGVFDTHDWLFNPLREQLFRFSGKYSLRPLKDDEEETILMKPSKYSMDSTWRHFYDIKKSMPKDTDEYKEAKLVMNKTIGQWHSKDKDEKRFMHYDDHGSYRMAHIVAIAIARGNQKILDKLAEIDRIIPMFSVVHICVDGIVYLGDKEYGQKEDEFGEFSQEFTGCDFVMKGQNLYCAMKDGHCVKFKHGGYDLLDGKDIDESKDFTFDDLEKLGNKTKIGEIINGEEEGI